MAEQDATEAADSPPTVSATDPTEPGPPRGEGRRVLLDPVGARLPESCACCGGVAAASRVERQLQGEGSLIVPYCRPCLRHAEATATRALAATMASALAALTLAAALPIALPWLSATTIVGLVLGAAVLPLGLVAWTMRLRPPHSSRGRAVTFDGLGGVTCTNVPWGEKLAELNQTNATPTRQRQGRSSAWMLTGPMLGVVAAPFLHWLHHPLVRIVNLTDADVVVTVDGHQVAVVEPTSVEHPQAGVECRFPAGRRIIQSRDRAGRVVDTHRVLVRSGRQHLYAPGNHSYCFWIETVQYGRHGTTEPRIEPLNSKRRFWVLPPGIDTWFDRNPVNPSDARASGGALAALRQARCREAPREE